MIEAESPEEQKQILQYTICVLPKENRDLLEALVHLLRAVAEHSSANKMGLDNLAVVMAPNILYPAKDEETYGSALKANAVVKMILEMGPDLWSVGVKVKKVVIVDVTGTGGCRKRLIC